MSHYLRAAFLPDTFHEVNGVAHTSRQFEAFARRKQIPFLSVHGGCQTGVAKDGVVSILQLKRGPFAFPLDANLNCDPFLIRHYRRVKEQVRAFGAEVIHITGPGDMGLLGWRLASDLRLPLAMSWHTSLHEYAGSRLERLLSRSVLNVLPHKFRQAAAQRVENLSLQFLGFFYRHARVLLAPNPELVRSIKLKRNYVNGSGPDFDATLAELRKKYGPESLLIAQGSSEQFNTIELRWDFDPDGHALQGDTARKEWNCTEGGDNGGPACPTLTALEVLVQADGVKKVNTLTEEVRSYPLDRSAEESSASASR